MTKPVIQYLSKPIIILFLLLPSLPGLCYFMKEIVSQTDVAFYIYARSIVPIKINLLALVALAPH
jgi:hypothetical protein